MTEMVDRDTFALVCIGIGMGALLFGTVFGYCLGSDDAAAKATAEQQAKRREKRRRRKERRRTRQAAA